MNEVHLWRVAAVSAGLDLSPLLAPDERSRAAATRLAGRRQQYAGVRAALRYVLAGYLRTHPRAIAFCYGVHGKPALHPRFASSGISFSVAHARAQAVIAVARTSALGVDIERVVQGEGVLAVAERIFAPREAAALRALAAADVPYAFTAIWTRKEAYAKALGDGLTLPLAGFEVSASPHPPAVVRCAASDPCAPQTWRLAQITSVPDHVCAVAMASGPGQRPPQAIGVREHSLAAVHPRAWASRPGVAC